jgi:hydroxypyruvate reductase
MSNPEIFVAFRLPTELSGLLDMPLVVHQGDGGPPTLDAAQCEGVRAIVTNGIKGADAALIGLFPNLELIASLGIGLDAIDLDAARRRGVAVTNTPGVNADDVADLAMAMLIDRLRNIRTANRFLLAGQWHSGPFPLARSLYGKTIGIVGLGAIGRAIARRAEAHRLRIQWTGPRPKADAPYEYVPDLEQLARECDVLVVCCAGGPATRHLINAPVLAGLGSEGILINVARGAIVDTGALIRALQSGQIAGAALDVYENQPQVPPELMAMEQVLLTPHLGSATKETRARMGAMVIKSLADHFAGRPLQHRVV